MNHILVSVQRFVVLSSTLKKQLENDAHVFRFGNHINIRADSF
jgi:hypothetical protein